MSSTIANENRNVDLPSNLFLHHQFRHTDVSIHKNTKYTYDLYPEKEIVTYIFDVQRNSLESQVMSNYTSTMAFLHSDDSNRGTTQHNKIEKYTSRD